MNPANLRTPRCFSPGSMSGRLIMTNRDNCRYIAFLYDNDRTHFDKPGCLKWHGSWPNKWDCPDDCKDFEEIPND